MRRRFPALCILGLLAMGCSDPVEPEAEDLVGSWVVADPPQMPVLLSAAADREIRVLRFTDDGRYYERVGTVASLRTVQSGRYRVGDNAIVFVGRPPFGMYEGGPFSVFDGVLRIRFIGPGPADEAVHRMTWLVPFAPTWR